MAKTLCALLLGSISLLAGCATARTAPPPLLVPSAVLRGSDVPADYLLPTGSLAEANIPRGERTAWAPAMAEASAYTIYTFDAEPIGLYDGYRYRYVVRQGFTLP